MNKLPIFNHWQLHTDENYIMWALLDRRDRTANSISTEVLQELSVMIEELANNSNQLKGFIIGSAKSQSFIVGADLQQVQQSDAKQIENFILLGQEVFNRLEKLSIPTLAIIEGYCLGGGMELALACRYRLLEDSSKVQMGLPEIKLGIHPGWGGSIRLPRMIGALKAMELMLTGKTVDAKTAYRLGIADAIVPKRHLLRAAKQIIFSPPPRKKSKWLHRLSNHRWIRPFISRLLYSQLQKKKVDRLHYPAPYALIDHWTYAGIHGQHAYKSEAKSILKCATTETAANLMRVFSLQEKLKSQGDKNLIAHMQHIHVVGAGVMGGDIAALFALCGYVVTLQDRDPKAIANTYKRAYQWYKRKLKQPHLIQAALDRLIADPEGHGVSRADCIIEAIIENLLAKQTLWSAIETHAKPSAIFATNTSSIPIDQINQILNQPSRLLGIHFFNPVAQMPLVEIVVGSQNNSDDVTRATALVRAVDKYPLIVKSCPGFLVNRVLMPYLLEAMELIEEGNPIQAIDQAALAYGMPMGPVLLADTVGLDVCLSVAQILLAGTNPTLPSRLIDLVNQKKLGKKTSGGFYSYNPKGQPIRQRVNVAKSTLEKIQQRLILRLQNECAACLREQVVADMDHLDAGMIFGTGFAPFRGGPLHAAHKTGIAHVMTQLQALSDTLGFRFNPDPYWDVLLQETEKA